MAYAQGGLNGIEATSGVTASSASAVERVLLQNYDSNPAQVNRGNNNKEFLSLTAQHTTVQFTSKSLDITFGNGAGTVGTNPYFEAPSTASKVFIA